MTSHKLSAHCSTCVHSQGTICERLGKQGSGRHSQVTVVSLHNEALDCTDCSFSLTLIILAIG